MDRIIMTASSVSVSEMISNRKYLSVAMRMFSTRENRNTVRVTEAFIDDIIANKSDYVGMGLFADLKKLKSKDYKRGLTHMYDERTEQFYADQVGSFYDFEKIEDEYGVSLIGYARVPKRSRLVCSAIQDLYDSNALNFSFEISAGSVRVEDGVKVVDVDSENELTGMAIVSVPAYPESKALDLVAEVNMDQLFENTRYMISEIDIETVRNCFWKWLCENFKEPYAYRVLLFCLDSVIMYDMEHGVTLKVEYRLSEDNCEMIFDDFYEVDFVRHEQVNEMASEAMEAEATATSNESVEVQAEVNAEAEAPEVHQAEEAEVEAECKNEEAESTEDANCKQKAEQEVDVKAEADAEAEVEVAETDSKTEDVKQPCVEYSEAQIEELLNIKAEYENMKAEYEAIKAEYEAMKAAEAEAAIVAEKNSLKAYAEKEGLDVNNELIAEAIETLNYKTIVSEVSTMKANEKPQEAMPVIAAYCDIKPVGGYSYLLERR